VSLFFSFWDLTITKAPNAGRLLGGYGKKKRGWGVCKVSIVGVVYPGRPIQPFVDKKAVE
jgi:hypothetical protein